MISKPIYDITLGRFPKTSDVNNLYKTAKLTGIVSVNDFSVTFAIEVLRRVKGFASIIALSLLSQDIHLANTDIAIYFAVVIALYALLIQLSKKEDKINRTKDWNKDYFIIKRLIYRAAYLFSSLYVFYLGDYFTAIGLSFIYFMSLFFCEWLFQHKWRIFLIEAFVILICMLGIYFFKIDIFIYLIIAVLTRIGTKEIFGPN